MRCTLVLSSQVRIGGSAADFEFAVPGEVFEEFSNVAIDSWFA